MEVKETKNWMQFSFIQCWEKKDFFCCFFNQKREKGLSRAKPLRVRVDLGVKKTKMRPHTFQSLWHTFLWKAVILLLQGMSTVPLLTRKYYPVDWGCRMHLLVLCRGTRHHQRVSWYDTNQSDGEVPLMLGLWGMRNTPSLPSLPGPLWAGVVATDKDLIYGLNRTNCILMLSRIVWIRTVWQNWLAWNRNVFYN